MHWIYILKCEENIIYVGETKRLYRRLNEHVTNVSHLATTVQYRPDKFMGLYNLKNNLKLLSPTETLCKMYDDFFTEQQKKIDALELENEITEMYMKVMGNKWSNVYGGKYCGYRPKKNPSFDIELYRPYCDCKLPAEIYEYKNKKYWRCCRKNIWEDLKDVLINRLNFSNNVIPCNYYKEYRKNDRYECKYKYDAFDFIPTRGVCYL